MAQAPQPSLGRALSALPAAHWLHHGLFWAVDTALVVNLFLHGMTTDFRLALRDACLVLLPHLVLTYALLYGVLPALWQASRSCFLLRLLAWFGLSAGVTFGFRFLVFVPLHAAVASSFRDYHVVFSIGPYVLMLCTVGVAACLRLYRQLRQKQLDNARLAHENYLAELQLLKAQIHPHFLFNTLNNLYALTLKQSSQAPEVVERLASLLQFVLEQGDAPLVDLAAEVALLRNYVALEQLRYGARLTLQFEANDIPPAGRIAPLLLLPLVENAFKHGSAEQVGLAHIRIVLAGAGPRFSCTIINTKNAAPAPPADHHGIGLLNVRKRLELLYPQRHRFEVESGDETFTIRLELPAATEGRAAYVAVSAARPPVYAAPIGAAPSL